MAADLTRAVMAAGLIAASGWPAAAAPPLADPTRPPAFAAPAAEAGPRTGGPGRTPAPAAAPAPPPPAPVLQSLQVGGLGQATALVDGRLLRVGDRLGPRTVTAIDAQGLTLRADNGRSERLELLTGVVKHAAGRAPAAGSVQAQRHEPPVAAASTPLREPVAPGPLAGRTTP